MYTSTVQYGPLSANAALLSPNPLSPSAPSPPSLGCPALPPPGLSQGYSMECWRSSSQKDRTTSFFRPILSTLSASRNPILTPLSGFLDSLRYDRTHSRSGILCPGAMHASGGVVIFVRQGQSFSELCTSSLSLLDPFSDYVGINIFLDHSSSRSFLPCIRPPYLFLPDGW